VFLKELLLTRLAPVFSDGGEWICSVVTPSMTVTVLQRRDCDSRDCGSVEILGMYLILISVKALKNEMGLHDKNEPR
jgi:hypothetical protein